MNGAAIASQAVAGAGPPPVQASLDPGAVATERLARIGTERRFAAAAAGSATIRATRP